MTYQHKLNYTLYRRSTDFFGDYSDTALLVLYQDAQECYLALDERRANLAELNRQAALLRAIGLLISERGLEVPA